jgi:hypothetical protein
MPAENTTRRQEAVNQLTRALAYKGVEAECTRCGAKERWAWLENSVDLVDTDPADRDGTAVTRVCTRCGGLDSYDLALLFG